MHNISFGDVFLPNTESSASSTSASLMSTSSTATGQSPVATSLTSQAGPTLASPVTEHSTHPPTSVGFAIGFPLAFLLLAAVVVLIWREHRRKGNQRAAQQQSTEEIIERVKVLEELLKRTSRAEFCGLDLRGRTWHELSNEALYELAASVERYELAANMETYELAANTDRDDP